MGGFIYPGGGAVTAETSSTGVPLIDGTQTILTATAPDDGKTHYAVVTVKRTHLNTIPVAGGEVAVALSLYPPDTTLTGFTISATTDGVRGGSWPIPGGHTITVKQTTAMTTGAGNKVCLAKIVII